eukprot:CAMPEP_0117682460 /NCGR_PEP_ID=MMETSP0804-20121206/19673_1 /TAXON_ID=1074897 /ORGANISM="Tetraselmis astigmatica, Strain CCMP880" /LENGTH=59 /DNA_ID=CAMNT_0005492577 /DNA_START=245 /DNA_END=424 /DNA_ORIENTATION=-
MSAGRGGRWSLSVHLDLDGPPWLEVKALHNVGGAAKEVVVQKLVVVPAAQHEGRAPCRL